MRASWATPGQDANRRFGIPQARAGSRKKNKWFGRTIFFCLLAWAIITELRKPEEERTWHGKPATGEPTT